MEIVSVFYAAFGYLALVAAILWGMLFVGDGGGISAMDAGGAAAPLKGIFVDLGLLLLPALLHRSTSRGMLRHVAWWSIPRRLQRSTQAWAAAAVLVVIYAGWQPLPQIVWNWTGPLQWALSMLFYIGWTLIMIGTFLVNYLEVFQIAGAEDMTPPAAADDVGQARAAGRRPLIGTLRDPLYGGILIAMWATSVMTVGHLLLASAVTAYLLLDAMLAARKAGGAREPGRTASFQGQRVPR